MTSVSCGVKLKSFDPLTQEKELHIAEDAGVSRVCVQWFESQELQRIYTIKCVELSELRKILFPNAGVW